MIINNLLIKYTHYFYTLLITAILYVLSQLDNQPINYINSLFINNIINNRIIFGDTYFELILIFIFITITAIGIFNNFQKDNTGILTLNTSLKFITNGLVFNLKKNVKNKTNKASYGSSLEILFFTGLYFLFLSLLTTFKLYGSLLQDNVFVLVYQDIAFFTDCGLKDIKKSPIFNSLFSIEQNKINFFFISYNFFLDGVSIWLCWLTSVIGFIITLSNIKKSKSHNIYVYSIYNKLLYIILFLIFICFVTKNIFLFFVSFEIILFPLFIHMILQGSRVNKNFAIKFLVIYTLIGSIFLWYSILYFIEIVGSSDYDIVRWSIYSILDNNTRILLFMSIFIGFALKVPIVPVHQWLILAHVEAPTNGSIILAALLLKIGGYGMYRFVYSLFPMEVFLFSYIIMGLLIISYTYSTVLAIRQVDVKRFIAYTSISHMNFSLIGLFSGYEIGISGFVHTMLSHGIISTGLFYLIGYLYSNVGYRDSIRLSGLSETVPVFSVVWFIFSIANLGLPLFSGFPGEFFVICSITAYNVYLTPIIFLGFFLTGVYIFFQLNKFLFGLNQLVTNQKISDLGSEALSVCVFLIFWSVVLGLFPSIVINSIFISIM